MKYLKKYNESSNNLENTEEVIEYIKLCFVEFYDRFGDKITTELFTADVNNSGATTFNMTIVEPELGNYDNISEFVRHGDEVAEFYKDIENCLEKVAIRYDIETHFEYQWPPEGYITIIFVLEGTYDNDNE